MEEIIISTLMRPGFLKIFAFLGLVGYILAGGRTDLRIKAGALLSGISTLDVISAGKINTSLNVDVIRFRKTPEIITGLVKGEIDVAVIPAEMAAKLYENGAKIKIISADMFQNQAVLSISNNIKNVFDLKGKKIAALLASGTFMTFKSYLLESYKMEDGKDYTVINAVPGALPDILKKGDADAVVVWEPLVSLLLSQGAHVVVSFDQLWKSLGYSGKPVMLVWVTSPHFNSRKIIDEFVKLRERAANYWINHPEETVNILKSTYQFKEKVANSIYKRVSIVTCGLTPEIIKNIRKVWRISWKGGYLEKNPETIPDSIFYRSQDG